MEIIPYLIGVAMFVLVVYWSAANATAKPGDPSFGLLRYTESTLAAAAEERERKRQRRSFQPLAQTAPDTAATPARPRPGRPDPAPRLPRR